MENEEPTTILLVEDDDGHARLVQELFAEGRIANPILRMRDGQDAWDFVSGKGEKGLQPGKGYLMLLDIRMPGMDGIELLGLIKADPRLSAMPVIMLTTTDDPQEITRCYGLGCNAYLIKPLDFEKFAEVIKKLGNFIRLMKVGKTKVRLQDNGGKL